MQLWKAFFGLVASLCLSNPAMCAVVYNVRFDQTSVTLIPGSQFTFNVYFEETVSDGSPHLLEPAGAVGLIDGSLQATLSGTGTTAVTDATGNAGFDFIDLTTPGVILQSTLVNSPVLASDVGGGTYRVQLGTVTVTAGTPGDTNTLTLASHPVNTITIDDGFGTPAFLVTPLNFGSVTINVSAVPEPSSCLLCVVAIGGASWWRSRARCRAWKLSI